MLDKEAVRCILRACDALNRDAAFEKEEEAPTPSFGTKYLEKWLTIRWRFCGLASSGQSAPPDLLDLLMDDFAHLEEAFAHSVQDPLGRKAFPSYNTILYRLLELYNCVHLAVDLPQLKTRRARKKTELFWWQMCKYLKWPYISSDAQFLKIKN